MWPKVAHLANDDITRHVVLWPEIADDHGQEVGVLVSEAWHLFNHVAIHMIQDTAPQLGGQLSVAGEKKKEKKVRSR